MEIVLLQIMFLTFFYNYSLRDISVLEMVISFDTRYYLKEFPCCEL